MKRREFITLLGGAAAWPLVARAQQRLPVIGFLGSASPNTFPERMRAYFQGLRQAGFEEGRNVAIEYRWAEGRIERLPALATELVQQKVDVIAAIGGPPQALAAKAATSTIPVVFQVGADPIALGLVASLSRPGGNITGVASLNVDVGPKRLELMHELLPSAKTIAFLFNPANASTAEMQTKAFQTAAQTLGIELRALPATAERDLEAAFARMIDAKVSGVVIGNDVVFTSRSAQLAELSLRDKLPAVSPFREFPMAGGLMSYGGDILDSWRLGGVYTGRVLKGEKPADLPVQQSTKVELIVNLKAAKALGFTVPMLLLGRADEVIE